MQVGGFNAVRYKALSTGVPLTNAFGEVCSRGPLFASCLWWQKTLEPVFRGDRFQTLFFFFFFFYRLPYYSSKYVLETRIEKDSFLPRIPLHARLDPLLFLDTPILLSIGQDFSKTSIGESKRAHHLIQLYGNGINKESTPLLVSVVQIDEFEIQRAARIKNDVNYLFRFKSEYQINLIFFFLIYFPFPRYPFFSFTTFLSHSFIHGFRV